MTNKLFNCGCKTNFTGILDEVSGLTGCFIVTKLRRDVCKNFLMMSYKCKCSLMIPHNLQVNWDVEVCFFGGGVLPLFNMDRIPQQTKHPLCVHTGWVKVRTRSASAACVPQQTKCLGAGPPQDNLTMTGGKQKSPPSVL